MENTQYSEKVTEGFDVVDKIQVGDKITGILFSER
jgi:hypothetical protein